MSRNGNAVTFLRKVPDGPDVRHDAVLEGSPRRLKIRWPDVGALELTPRAPNEAVGAFARPPGEPAYVYRRPVDIGDGWTTANARDTGMDENALAQTVRGVIGADPKVRRPSLIHSMLVAHRGKFVLEEYFYGHGRDTPHDMRSAGKTFSSVMLGAAMLRGVKISPQTRIYEVMGDLGPFANPDPRKQQITLAHLMTHTSGLDCDDYNDKSLGNENTMTTQRQQPDWWKYTLDLAQMHDPGKRYASIARQIRTSSAETDEGHRHVAAAALRRNSGATPAVPPLPLAAHADGRGLPGRRLVRPAARPAEGWPDLPRRRHLERQAHRERGLGEGIDCAAHGNHACNDRNERGRVGPTTTRRARMPTLGI